jgi:hypothetical protein
MCLKGVPGSNCYMGTHSPRPGGQRQKSHSEQCCVLWSKQYTDFCNQSSSTKTDSTLRIQPFVGDNGREEGTPGGDFRRNRCWDVVLQCLHTTIPSARTLRVFAETARLEAFRETETATQTDKECLNTRNNHTGWRYVMCRLQLRFLTKSNITGSYGHVAWMEETIN